MPTASAAARTSRARNCAALYAHGRNVAGSILGLDMTGADVEETGLVWSVGDADQCCRPVPGSLTRAPWLRRPTAQVLGTMFELDGTSGAGGSAPRAGPRRAAVRGGGFHARGRRGTRVLPARAWGRTARCGLASGQLSGQQRTRIDAYGLGRLDDMSPLFDDLYAAARAQGLPVRTLMSEYAPGQFEITLEHRADALRAVDEAILFKRAVRGVAARHGRIASFMAKPFAELAGSGLHLHASLADRERT